MTGSAVAADGQAVTRLRIETAAPDGTGSRPVIVRVHRILQPGGGTALGDGAGRPCLSAAWRLPDGTLAHGVFASARYTS